MTIKQFIFFALSWLAICSAIIEPAYIAPYFDELSGLELAFNGQVLTLKESASPSNDHFRVLCLLYFALPCVVYLGSQMLLLRKHA